MEYIQFDFNIFLPMEMVKILWNGCLMIGEGNESLQAFQNLVEFEVGLNIMKCKI